MLAVIVIFLSVSTLSGCHGCWMRQNCNTFNCTVCNISLSALQRGDEIDRSSVLRASSSHGNIFVQLSKLNEIHLPWKETENKNCTLALRDYENKLLSGDITALKMFDANAKLPAGMLKGNLNQFGDFDECMELEGAQYCLLEIDLRKFWIKMNHLEIENMVHSDYIIQGTFTDPAHRVPNFSLVKWALCLPKTCGRRDVLSMAERRSNGGFRVHLRPQLCQQKTGEGKWSAMKVFSMSAFGALVLVLMGSSLTPQARFGENKWYLAFKSFSLQNTLPQLLASKPSSFKSIHGIRALSALALFMCHKAITQLFGPYTNANDLAHSMSHPWRIIGRTAFIYTDSFILLSVFLTASSYIASLQRDNTLGIRNRIVQRLFRILPNFMVVMVFSTYILPQLGSGPLWPLLVDQHAGLCKKYMWRNLLFIHNYFGFKNMCLTHTHQLAIDMQLFLFSPIIIYVVYSRRTLGWIFAIILAFISCILRAGAILKWKLSYVVYFGITISKMFETADYSYIMPTHRAGVYIIGICLAFVLRDGFGATFRNHKHATKIYTVITVTLGCYAVVGPYWMTKKFYKYNVGEAIAFGVLSPIFWSLAICFTLHAEKYNYGGWLVQLFGWNGFQFFSRISYSFYLMQFPVFFYNVAKRRHSSEYNPYILVETGETLVVVLLSTVLTLCVEIPFLNIYSIIFKGRRTKT